MTGTALPRLPIPYEVAASPRIPGAHPCLGGRLTADPGRPSMLGCPPHRGSRAPIHAWVPPHRGSRAPIHAWVPTSPWVRTMRGENRKTGRLGGWLRTLPSALHHSAPTPMSGHAASHSVGKLPVFPPSCEFSLFARRASLTWPARQPRAVAAAVTSSSRGAASRRYRLHRRRRGSGT